MVKKTCRTREPQGIKISNERQKQGWFVLRVSLMRHRIRKRKSVWQMRLDFLLSKKALGNSLLFLFWRQCVLEIEKAPWWPETLIRPQTVWAVFHFGPRAQMLHAPIAKDWSSNCHCHKSIYRQICQDPIIKEENQFLGSFESPDFCTFGPGEIDAILFFFFF